MVYCLASAKVMEYCAFWSRREIFQMTRHTRFASERWEIMGYRWRGLDELPQCSLKLQALWWALWNRADIVEGKFRRHTQRPVFALEIKLLSFWMYSSVSSTEGNAFLWFIWRMVEEVWNRVSTMLVPKANNSECGIFTVSPVFSQKFYVPGSGVYFSVFLQSNFTI